MRHRPAALIFILVTVLIDVIGIGIIIPVFPELMMSLAGGSENKGAAAAGWLAAIYSVMQFLCAPILGALSDRFGRRPVLLAALFGTGADYLFLFFAPNLAWLVVGRVIAGILGASFTVANAYIADVSPPEERAKNFGYIGAAFGVGFIVGPLIGGLLGHYGVRVPFAFAAGLSLLNAVYGLFVLPESLPAERRSERFSRKDLNPFAILLRVWNYPVFRLLVTTFVLVYMGQQAIFHTWVFFTEAVLRWDTRQNGIALAVVGILTAIVQAGLVGKFVEKFGERKTILIGLALSSIELLGFGLSRTGWMMYATLLVGSLGGIAGPTLQGYISKQVDESEQGVIQGGLTSVQSLVGVFGPVVMTSTFAYFNGGGSPVRIPGAAFFLGAIFALIGFVVTYLLFRRMRDERGSGPVTAV